MSLISNLGRESQVAFNTYGHRLSAMYRPGWDQYDPGYALGRDIEVYDKLREDAVIDHAMTYRKHLVAGRKWNLIPASKEQGDVMASHVMTQLVKKIQRFTSARFNHSGAFMTGSEWALVDGRTMNLPLGDKIVRKWWVPMGLKHMNRLRVIRKAVELPDGTVDREYQVWNVKNNKFERMDHPEWYVKHIYDDVEQSLGFGRGLLDSIYYVWWAKGIIWNEALGGVERWGRGFIVAKINGSIPGSIGKTNAALRGEFLDELEAHQARHILAIDGRHDVEVINGPGQGWQLVKEMIDYCDNVIRTLILGSNLPTAGSGGEGGSFAMAKVQENSTESLIQYDRELLAETYTNDLLNLIWRVNRFPLVSMGLGNIEMPQFNIEQEKHVDPLKHVQVGQALVQAGADVKEEDIFRDTGYSPVGKGILKGKDVNQQQTGLGGLGGFGSPGGGGGLGGLPQPPKPPMPRGGE